MIQLPNRDEFKAKALAAIDAGQLQCQQSDFIPNRWWGCLYSGPCIIGAVLSHEDRQTLDDYCDELSIQDAIEAEDLVAAPDWIAVSELEAMQRLHDGAQVNELRAMVAAL